MRDDGVGATPCQLHRRHAAASGKGHPVDLMGVVVERGGECGGGGGETWVRVLKRRSSSGEKAMLGNHMYKKKFQRVHVKTPTKP